MLNISKIKINDKPFMYFIKDNCLDIEFAKKCQEEILNIENTKWDRYDNPFEKKYTLRDKENLPSHLSKLFNYLVSDKWLDILGTIMKVKLYNDPTKNWWGIHKYENGDYLDIHSDAGIHPITKQKKHCTLGIYLSKDWSVENKGELELWDGTDININPKLLECKKKIVPYFNRLIVFTNTNNAWHGNPTPVICKNEKRIFVTISYLSNTKDSNFSNKLQKALFIKLPDEKYDEDKEKLRKMRADKLQYKLVYTVK